MTQYDDRNTFVLFANDKRSKDKDPHYKGSFTDIENNEYWVAAWKNVSKSGKTYLRGRLTPKEADATPQNTSSTPDFDDDVPF